MKIIFGLAQQARGIISAEYRCKGFFKSLKPNCFDYGSNQLFVGTRNHKVIGINLDDWKTRTYYDGESNHDIFN